MGPQSLFDVIQRDPITTPSGIGLLVEWVRYGDFQLTAEDARSDLHDAPGARRLDTVIDGVFNDWLEAQQRQAGTARHFVDLSIDCETIAKSKAFDVQVALDKGYFLVDRDRRTGIGEVGAKQVGEIFYGALGEFRIRSRQARDCIHAVKKEMRPDTRL